MTKLVHNPFSQDIYADATVGFFTYNGNMRITLESVRSDYTQEPIATDRVVVGRSSCLSLLQRHWRKESWTS